MLEKQIWSWSQHYTTQKDNICTRIHHKFYDQTYIKYATITIKSLHGTDDARFLQHFFMTLISLKHCKWTFFVQVNTHCNHNETMSNNARRDSCSSLPGISSSNTAIVSANMPKLAKTILSMLRDNPMSCKNFTFVSNRSPCILVAFTEFSYIK